MSRLLVSKREADWEGAWTGSDYIPAEAPKALVAWALTPLYKGGEAVRRLARTTVSLGLYRLFQVARTNVIPSL